MGSALVFIIYITCFLISLSENENVPNSIYLQKSPRIKPGNEWTHLLVCMLKIPICQDSRESYKCQTPTDIYELTSYTL